MEGDSGQWPRVDRQERDRALTTTTTIPALPYREHTINHGKEK